MVIMSGVVSSHDSMSLTIYIWCTLVSFRLQQVIAPHVFRWILLYHRGWGRGWGGINPVIIIPREALHLSITDILSCKGITVRSWPDQYTGHISLSLSHSVFLFFFCPETDTANPKSIMQENVNLLSVIHQYTPTNDKISVIKYCQSLATCRLHCGAHQ